MHKKKNKLRKLVRFSKIMGNGLPYEYMQKKGGTIQQDLEKIGYVHVCYYVHLCLHT